MKNKKIITKAGLKGVLLTKGALNWEKEFNTNESAAIFNINLGAEIQYILFMQNYDTISSHKFTRSEILTVSKIFRNYHPTKINRSKGNAVTFRISEDIMSIVRKKIPHTSDYELIAETLKHCVKCPHYINGLPSILKLKLSGNYKASIRISHIDTSVIKEKISSISNYSIIQTSLYHISKCDDFILEEN